MDLLENVNSGIGKFDVRTVDGQEVIPKLKSFSDEVELLDTDKNESKENGLIRFLDKRILKLEHSFEGDWNTGFPLGDVEDWEFFKAEDEKITYTCEEGDCTATYTNGQSFQRHLKKKHNVKKTVKMPTVTCRLPHKSGRDEQIVNHQITPHLSSVHKVEKQSADTYFKGFIRSGGKFQAVFRPEGAADPTNPNLEVPPQIEANNEALEREEHPVDDNMCLETIESPEEEPSRGEKSKIESPGFRGYIPDDGKTFTEVFKSPNAKMDGDFSKKMRRRCIDPSETQDLDIESTAGLAGDVAKAPGVDIEEDKMEDEPVNINIDADVNDFSDVEDSDSSEYTETRIKNKLYRYHLRETETKSDDLCNRGGNKEFIKDCTEFILKKNLSRKSDKSNLDKSTGHLFRYEDSLLQHLSKNDPGFNLSRLVAFHDKDLFVKIKDPMLSWIKETGGESGLENPGRQREQLKAHADIRGYLIRKIKETDFGNDIPDILWFGKMREHIEQISEDIEHSGVWGVLNTLEDQKRLKIQIAKEIINPEDSLKELNALKVYFASEKYRNRELKLQKIFQDAVDTNEISHKDFYAVGNFSRVLLALMDRLRRGSYKFTNNDYGGRQARWMPEGTNQDDFCGIPEGLLCEEPEDKRPADQFVIKLSGENQKGGSSATVTINQKAEQWLQKYRQLKSIAFGSPLEPDEPFFQNLNKKAFGPINSGKGSIMAEFRSVTGLKTFTTTSARRTLQPHIQSNEILKARTKTISQHSKEVASKHYDRTAGDFRASVMHFVGQSEGTNQASSNILPDSEETEAKRRKLNEEDRKVALEKAKELVESFESNRRVKLGPRCKVKKEDRLYMQSVFTAGGDLEGIVAIKTKLKGNILS